MATIDDVAKRSGVSSMTVSRVMNHNKSVSDATREKVWKAARELGYRPNLIARSLATSRTNTLGVLLTHIENPLYGVFLSSMIREAEKLGYDIIVAGGEDVDGSVKGMNTLIGKCVDGLAVFPVEFRDASENEGMGVGASVEMCRAFYEKSQSIFADCARNRIPVVVLGDHPVEEVNGRVLIDYYACGYKAAEYLCLCGHKKIGFLDHMAGDKGIWGDRRRGYRDALKDYGKTAEERWIVRCIDSVDSGFYAMQNLIAGNAELPTAVWCANDMIAAGAISAAIGAGIRIPEDLSVIGNDGSYVREITVPRLTTVSIQPQEAGILCLRMLYSLISGEETERTAVVEPAVLEGRSVRRI